MMNRDVSRLFHEAPRQRVSEPGSCDQIPGEEVFDRFLDLAIGAAIGETENPLREVRAAMFGSMGEAFAVALHRRADGALASRLVGEKNHHRRLDGKGAAIEDFDNLRNLLGVHVNRESN